MQVDALALRLRPRAPMEAADLGCRLVQQSARSIYPCYAVALLPVVALAVASASVASWLPSIVLWWAKPWLDRTILFVLSRAAFGQRTTIADLWQAQRQVWWRQIGFTWTIRRLSPWRSLTQPVYQLEGASIAGASARVRQIRSGRVGAAFLVSQAFWVAETGMAFALVSLAFWFAPAGLVPDLSELFSGEASRVLAFTIDVSYGVAIAFVEPFYVAAGFAMYLTRRTELEAWDIEQEFRRAFAA